MSKYLNINFIILIFPAYFCIAFVMSSNVNLMIKRPFSPWKIKETERGRLKIINEKKNEESSEIINSVIFEDGFVFISSFRSQYSAV